MGLDSPDYNPHTSMINVNYKMIATSRNSNRGPSIKYVKLEGEGSEKV